MPERNLELTVLRNGRRQDVIDMFADPDDIPALEGRLRGWLSGNKWHESRWGEFEAEVRLAGEGKVRRKVRA